MNILFVDDDAMNRRVVRDMLRVGGVDLAEAEDGPSGLSMVEQHEYALILMDLRMPGMDGFEAIRRIRARGDAKAATPVIVVTADTSPTIQQDAEAAGANEVMTKPVAMSVLFDTIGRVLAAGPAGGVLS